MYYKENLSNYTTCVYRGLENYHLNCQVTDLGNNKVGSQK